MFYNQIDPYSFILDKIYSNLSSNEIIKNKEEFGLINKGIKHLFNKNINTFECKYKSKSDDFNQSLFKLIFDNIEYSLIIICTKNENKRFGAFCKNKVLVPNLMMNQMNLNPILPPYPLLPNSNNQNMNNNAINVNTNDENVTIFDSISSPDDYFIFSLDKLDIYYKEKNITGNMIPNFKLIFNNKYQSLLGNEYLINNLYELT